MHYADVILPVPLHATFTYAVPETLSVVEGMRVLVPFGRGKKYVGVVDRVHDQQPQDYVVKAIETVMDEQPIVTTSQLIPHGTRGVGWSRARPHARAVVV